MHTVTRRTVVDELDRFFAGIRPGRPGRAGDLWLVPLVSDEPGADAIFLPDALRKGTTSVVEVCEAGRVDRVRVDHRGELPLLLLAGEEITGARQNRAFNATFLVPDGVTVELPVSCVERGRWGGSGAFRAPGRTVTSQVRAGMLHRTTHSMVTRGVYDADQGEVWTDVDRYLERTRVTSRTSALADSVALHEREVQAHLSRLQPLARQVGVAAVRSGRLLSLDALASPSLFARAWPHFAHALFSELGDDDRRSFDPVHVVRSSLAEAMAARRVRQWAPAGGETVHAASASSSLGAVVAGNAVYHCVIVGT